MSDQILFYGKGGVGTSTLISNISAALVETGFKVMQVGCDSIEQIEPAALCDTDGPDYVLYDLSGRYSFSGSYNALQNLGAKLLFVVTNADLMSLSAVNAIYANVERLGESQPVTSFGGLIPDCISNSFEESFVSDFAHHTKTQTLGQVPRSLMVRQCELYGKTVIEAAPLSTQAIRHLREKWPATGNGKYQNAFGPVFVMGSSSDPLIFPYK